MFLLSLFKPFHPDQPPYGEVFPRKAWPPDFDLNMRPPQTSLLQANLGLLQNALNKWTDISLGTWEVPHGSDPAGIQTWTQRSEPKLGQPRDSPFPTVRIFTKIFRHGCGSNTGTPNGTLVSGMDQNLRNPSCLFLSHPHVVMLTECTKWVTIKLMPAPLSHGLMDMSHRQSCTRSPKSC